MVSMVKELLELVNVKVVLTPLLKVVAAYTVEFSNNLFNTGQPEQLMLDFLAQVFLMQKQILKLVFIWWLLKVFTTGQFVHLDKFKLRFNYSFKNLFKKSKII